MGSKSVTLNRYKQILTYRSVGYRTIHIAELLNLSQSTIEKDEIEIQSMLKAKTMTHAVAIALRSGMIK